MSSINLSIIEGRLGSKPEVRETKGGTKVTNLSVATSDKWQDKQGEWQEDTEWHRVVLWAGKAEYAGRNLDRGDKVFIQGPSKTRTYEDKDGIERRVKEIEAEKLKKMQSNNKDEE